MKNYVIQNDDKVIANINPDNYGCYTITDRISEFDSRIKDLHDIVEKYNKDLSKSTIKFETSVKEVKDKYIDIYKKDFVFDKKVKNINYTQNNLISHEIVTGSNLIIISRNQHTINSGIINNIGFICTIFKLVVGMNIFTSSIILIYIILNIL